MKKINLKVSTAVILLFISLWAKSQELSQWRGDDRSGVYKEKNLLTQWPENGPKMLWFAQGMPKGFSSVAVANGLVYFTGLQDTLDVLVAIDYSGQKKWQTVIGKSWVFSFPDSRCTPTVEGNKIYVTSGFGDVACIDAITGKTIWNIPALVKFQGKFSTWGCSESPLIVDDKVIFTAGGDNTTIVALNKNNGETIWKSKTLNDTAVYASPILADFNGEKLILNVLANNLVGVNPNNGEIMCNFNYGGLYNKTANKDWGGASYTNTNIPVVQGNGIYVTSGYNHVGAKFKISDDLRKLTLDWVDSTLDVHHGGVVLIEGYIYGSNWLNNAKGNWCCIDWKTGKTMYETFWKSKGSIIANDGLLYCFEEKSGWIALVRATPEKFDLVSSFKVPYGSGPYWAHPMIKDGVLYVRHGDAIMAFDIKKY